jgi:endonuclease V-like protein UPF0215 family
VKPGARALGIAESYATDRSTLAGVVVRASRVVDGFIFGSCTVGGTDATDAIAQLWDRLARPDVRFLFVAGIAPAWYNVVDLHRLHDRVERPVLSVTFEDSDGLEPAIREAFDGEAATRRIVTYQAQPDRRAVAVDDGTVYARSVGLDETRVEDVVRAFTPAGERPEPVRVARQAARAADEFSR